MAETAQESVTRWQRRPGVAEAVQWTGSNQEAITAFIGFSRFLPATQSDSPRILLWSGAWPLWRGDWVVRENGRLHVVPAELFARDFEPAGEHEDHKISDDKGGQS